MKHTIYFSLGSNISPKLTYLKKAVRELKKSGIKIEKLSSVYRTAPAGYKDQPYFYNAVGKGNTILSPMECLKLFKSIEKRLGRKPRRRFGPREIDIDLLLYGNLKVKSRKLTIPHPRMNQRKFVLIPLLEINPRLKLPRSERVNFKLACNLLTNEQKAPKGALHVAGGGYDRLKAVFQRNHVERGWLS